MMPPAPQRLSIHHRLADGSKPLVEEPSTTSTAAGNNTVSGKDRSENAAPARWGDSKVCASSKLHGAAMQNNYRG
jgi:hypothetical protein